MAVSASDLTAVSFAQDLVAFAHHLRLEEIPIAAVTAAKYHLLDTIGVAFAAASLPDLHELSGHLGQFTLGGRSVPGIRAKLSERDAALIFGMLVHGIEYDDTSVRGRLHPSGFCAPPALILGAMRGSSGSEVLRSYIAGVETSIRLGAVARGGISEVGFDPTGVIGTLGSAIVSSLMLESSEDKITRAMAMACSVASGNMEYLTELTYTKRLHAGNAAAAGITAAILGRTSIEVPKNPLGGRLGLYSLYANGASNRPNFDEARLSLGEDWLIKSELAYKPIPLCFFSIPAADAASEIRAAVGLNPDQIDQIVIHIPQAAIATIAEPEAPRRRPMDRYAAQFSVYFAVAHSLLYGPVTLADFAPERFEDPRILALIDKTRCVVDQDSSFPKFYSAAVEVMTYEGETILRRQAVHRGSPDSGYAHSDVEEKFLSNVGNHLAQAEAEALRDLILALETISDISKLEAIYSA